MIAVAGRIAEELPGAVEQAIIDAPAVDRDAGQRRATTADVGADAVVDVAPDAQDVPVQALVDGRRAVVEARQRLNRNARPVPAPEHDAPAGGAQIDGQKMIDRHGVTPQTRLSRYVLAYHRLFN